MTEKIALIAAASGLVGSATIERFAAAGWKVIGLSRRAPAKSVPGVEYRCVDLLDSESTGKALADLEAHHALGLRSRQRDAGRSDRELDGPHHAARNGRMLENLPTRNTKS